MILRRTPVVIPVIVAVFSELPEPRGLRCVGSLVLSVPMSLAGVGWDGCGDVLVPGCAGAFRLSAGPLKSHLRMSV